jgi:hypothetical protein
MLKWLMSGTGPVFTLALGAGLVFLSIVSGGAGRAIAGAALITFSIYGLVRRGPPPPR